MQRMTNLVAIQQYEMDTCDQLNVTDLPGEEAEYPCACGGRHAIRLFESKTMIFALRNRVRQRRSHR